jgi:hypothetical protein
MIVGGGAKEYIPYRLLDAPLEVSAVGTLMIEILMALSGH